MTVKYKIKFSKKINYSIKSDVDIRPNKCEPKLL